MSTQTTEAPVNPSAETQAAIDAIFNVPPITNEMAPVTNVVVATDTPAGESPAAVTPPTGTPQVQPAQATVTGLPQDGAAPPAERNGQAPNMVPGARLKEEADRRRAAEQRAYEIELELATLRGQFEGFRQQPQQQMQPQTPAVDPNALPPQYRTATDFMLADAEGYTNWVRNSARAAVQAELAPQIQHLAQQNAHIAWKADEADARVKYGSQYVDQVRAYVARDPRLSEHFSKYPDATTKAVEWARDQQLRQAIPNGDVNAARMSWLQDALSNPEILQAIAPRLVQQATQPAAPPAAPPSLSATPRGMNSPLVMSTQDAVNNLFASRQAQAT